MLSWITTPTVLHGFVIGVFFSLLTALTWQLSLSRYVAAIFLASAFLLSAGALVGTLFFKRYVSKVTSTVSEPITSTLSRVISNLGNRDKDARRAALSKSLSDLTKNADQLLKSVLAAAMRFFAIGRLFALVGVIVSFSVFLATYMQVERLAEQNSLIQLQSLSAHQQIALQMRSEIVGVETLGTLAQELHTIYAQDAISLDDVTESCTQAEADWHQTIKKLIGKRSGDLTRERECIKKVARFLEKRSDNLESNRLLNQQITGSGLRLTVFSRDLTEQFTSQFSTLCNTDPQQTANAGRIWTAMDSLEQGVDQIIQELEKESDDGTVYLSGSPDSQIIDSIEKYLSLSRQNAVSVRDLGDAVIQSTRIVQQYLEQQKEACLARSSALRENLDQIDSEYENLLNSLRPRNDG